MAPPHIYFFFKKMTTTTTLECMVCYQEIKSDQLIRSCDECHIFHNECIKTWFTTNYSVALWQYGKNRCPLRCEGNKIKETISLNDFLEYQQKRTERVYLKNNPGVLPGNAAAAKEANFDDLQKLYRKGEKGKRGKSLDNHKGTTPLQTAIRKENLEAVKWLLNDEEKVSSYGLLHCAAQWTKESTSVLDFLLQNIAIDDKNRIFKTKTPLDYAYLLNKSKIKNEIIALMRKNDCKANWYNEDGVKVGKGLGDLNPPEGALKSVETD